MYFKLARIITKLFFIVCCSCIQCFCNDKIGELNKIIEKIGEKNSIGGVYPQLLEFDKTLNLAITQRRGKDLINLKNLLGKEDSSLAICDNVTIFSKLLKIKKFLANESITKRISLESLQKVNLLIGDTQNPQEDTLFYQIKKLFSDINNPEKIWREFQIGDLSGKIEEDTLTGILNHILYILTAESFLKQINSTEENSISQKLNTIFNFISNVNLNEDIIQGFGSWDLHDIEQSSPGETTTSLFHYIIYSLKNTSPFFREEEIQYLAEIIGGNEDPTEKNTLNGFLNKIISIINSQGTGGVSLSDLEKLLVEDCPHDMVSIFLNEAQFANNYKGNLNYKIIELLSPTASLLREVLFEYKDSENYSCLSLINGIINGDNSYEAVETVKNANFRLQEIIHILNTKTNLISIDYLTVSSAIMKLWNILYNVKTKDFSDLNSLIGRKYTLVGEYSLTSAVSEIYQGFYCNEIVHKFGAESLNGNKNGISIFEKTNSILSVINKKAAGNGDELKAFKDIFGSGNSFDSPDSFYKKLLFLNQAFADSYVYMNLHNFLESLNVLGDPNDNSESTLFGVLNVIAELAENNQLTQASRITKESGTKLLDILLYRLYKNAHAVSFEKVNFYFDYFYSKNTDEREFIRSSTLELNIDKLIKEISEDCYSLNKKSAIDLYSVFGIFNGNSNQTTLAGNIFDLEEAGDFEGNFGKTDEIRESVEAPQTNTIFGHINFIKKSLKDYIVCNCYSVGEQLFGIASNIKLINRYLIDVCHRANEIIIKYPTKNYTRQCFLKIENFLKIVSTNISLIKGVIESGKETHSVGENFGEKNYCCIYEIFEPLKTINICLHSFLKYISTGSVLKVEFYDANQFYDGSQVCTFFENGLNAVATEIQNLGIYETQDSQNISLIQNLLSSFTIISMPDYSESMITRFKDSLQNIIKELGEISLLPELCQHNSRDKVEQIKTKLNEFHGMIDTSGFFERFCCSSTDFQLCNISRLLSYFPKIITETFLTQNFQEKISDYMNDGGTNGITLLIANRFMKIAKYIKNLEGIFYKTHSIDICEVSMLEDVLIGMTNELFNITRDLQFFNSQHTEGFIGDKIRKYGFHDKLPHGEGYCCKNIPPHIELLTAELQRICDMLFIGETADNKLNSILSLIKNADYISYNPNLADSLVSFRLNSNKIFRSIDYIQKKMKLNKFKLCSVCDPGVDEKLLGINNVIRGFHSGFKTLLDTTKQTTCCSKLMTAKRNINSEFLAIKTNFSQLLDCFFIKHDSLELLEQNEVSERFNTILKSLHTISLILDEACIKKAEVKQKVIRKCCYADEFTEILKRTYAEVKEINISLQSLSLPNSDDAAICETSDVFNKLKEVINTLKAPPAPIEPTEIDNRGIIIELFSNFIGTSLPYLSNISKSISDFASIGPWDGSQGICQCQECSTVNKDLILISSAIKHTINSAKTFLEVLDLSNNIFYIRSLLDGTKKALKDFLNVDGSSTKTSQQLLQLKTILNHIVKKMCIDFESATGTAKK